MENHLEGRQRGDERRTGQHTWKAMIRAVNLSSEAFKAAAFAAEHLAKSMALIDWERNGTIGLSVPGRWAYKLLRWLGMPIADALVFLEDTFPLAFELRGDGWGG